MDAPQRRREESKQELGVSRESLEEDTNRNAKKTGCSKKLRWPKLLLSNARTLYAVLRSPLYNWPAKIANLNW